MSEKDAFESIIKALEILQPQLDDFQRNFVLIVIITLMLMYCQQFISQKLIWMSSLEILRVILKVHMNQM
jgi:hypothetical protein